MINKTRMIEMTDSGSGSTTKAEDQKKKKRILSQQQTYTNVTVPAQTTASVPASAPTAPKNVHYNNTNYRWEETDTGGGYDKRQIVWRSPDQPARAVIDVYRNTTPGVLLTQEEKSEKKQTYAQWDAEMRTEIAEAETRVKNLQNQKMSVSGRLYNSNALGETLNQLHMEEENLQRLKDEYYYSGMGQQQQFAQELYLRGGGTLWDAILREPETNAQIAQYRQMLASMPVSDPRRKSVEQKMQKDIDRTNYAKQIALEYGIDYNSLIEYAQWIEDEANMQKSVQFWTDLVQKDDRSMNAANWASVPLKVVGGITGGASNVLQSIGNTLSGQNRPIKQNTLWHYGTNAADAIRGTTGEIVEERLGGGLGGKIGRTVYERSMELTDAALGWGIKQFIVGSDLVSGNMKIFLEDMENAVDLVLNSAELMQTYQNALDEGLAPEEAFGECMLQITTESLKNISAQKFNKSFLKGFDEEPYAPRPAENLSMVVYQSPEQDDFMAGFRGEDLQHSGKADFYVSPSGEVLPGDYEGWIGENQRDTILSQIEDQTLRSVVGQMYSKDSVIGTGNLAELVHFSDTTGMYIVSKMEYRSAENAANYINKRLRAGMVSDMDKNILDTVMFTWNSVPRG